MNRPQPDRDEGSENEPQVRRLPNGDYPCTVLGDECGFHATGGRIDRPCGGPVPGSPEWRREREGHWTPPTGPECDGRCVTPEDLDVMGTGVEVAYPDPDCSRHGPSRDLRKRP